MLLGVELAGLVDLGLVAVIVIVIVARRVSARLGQAFELVRIIGIVLGGVLVDVLDPGDGGPRHGQRGDRRGDDRGSGALEQAGQVGRQDRERAGLDEELERAPCRTAAHQAVDLLEQPGRSALADLAAPAQEGLPGRGLEPEVEARGELHGAQHADRVLLEPHLGVADRAHQLRVEIGEATDVVDDLLALDVIEQAVDREVAAAGVLGLVAEDVVAADQKIVLVLLARVGAEGRGLDDLRAEEHVGEAKPTADDPRVAERRLDLVGRCARRNVPVLGRATDEEIANATADQVRLESSAGQLANHAIRVGIDGGAIERGHGG